MTEAGEYFYEGIRYIHSDWDTLLDETKSLHEDPKGLLRLACPQPVSSRFLMPFLADFRRQYPNIELNIIDKDISHLPSAEADISISRELNHYDSSTMIGLPFYQYHNSLFASPQYLENTPAITTAADLESHHCLSYGTTHKDYVAWQFKDKHFRFTPTFQTNNTEILISAALNQMGIIYIPEAIIPNEIKAGSLVPVLPLLKSEPLLTVAYFLKTKLEPRKIRLFIDALKTYF